MRFTRGMIAGATVACLSAVAVATAGTPASADIPTTVDVGLTILDTTTWEWKGSGSYSNGDGSFLYVCVQIRQDRPGLDTTLSSRCVDTAAGSQGEFSAPPEPCFAKLGWGIYTRTIAVKRNGGDSLTRTSNRIPHQC